MASGVAVRIQEPSGWKEEKDVAAWQKRGRAGHRFPRSRGAKSPRAGSRRLQRFYNQMLLRSTADPEDLENLEKLKSLFAVETSSLFSDLVRDPTLVESFEDFLHVTEEEEAELFRHLECPKARHEPFDARQVCCAKDQYKKIDRRARDLISSRPEYALSILQEVEMDIRSRVEEGLTLELGDGVGRMVTHGVAQFYGLRSWSEQNSDGQRLTFIRPTRAVAVPEETLHDYILRLRSGK